MTESEEYSIKAAMWRIIAEFDSLEKNEATNPYIVSLLRSRLLLLDGLLEKIKNSDFDIK